MAPNRESANHLNRTMPQRRKKHHAHRASKPTPPAIADSEIDVLRIFVKSTLGKKEGSAQKLSEASFGDIHVDFVSHSLFRNGKSIPVRGRELELLKYFLLHEGDVLSRDQLLQDVWGFDSNPTTRSVDNYVLLLRKKIETDPAHPRHILTLHGSGYKFNR